MVLKAARTWRYFGQKGLRKSDLQNIFICVLHSNFQLSIQMRVWRSTSGRVSLHGKTSGSARDLGPCCTRCHGMHRDKDPLSVYESCGISIPKQNYWKNKRFDHCTRKNRIIISRTDFQQPSGSILHLRTFDHISTHVHAHFEFVRVFNDKTFTRHLQLQVQAANRVFIIHVPLPAKSLLQPRPDFALL